MCVFLLGVNPYMARECPALGMSIRNVSETDFKKNSYRGKQTADNGTDRQNDRQLVNYSEHTETDRQRVYHSENTETDTVHLA